MIETLHDNEWLSLRTVRLPERGINGYVYSHETRCRGRIVAVLPYAQTPAGRRYLVRREVTPCWSLDPQLSAITGGYEGGDIEDDAVREVAEEAGYTITRADLLPLGESYASKSADTVYSLFAVDVTGRVQGEAAGDGSRLEAEGSTVWLNAGEVCRVRDPQVGTMVLRLADHLAHVAGAAAEETP
ncbi:NUDIX domain-containing protein [Micromonospora tulbaghiae]|uniref:NUDIX domain-containing protein n=1 Tax=Micromonospora tulbaghiae TaxID=479978 RepID=UPI003400738A